MAMLDHVTFYTRTCRSVGEHIEFVHHGGVDRCLCGGKTRRCKGNCGLTDMTWLGPGLSYGNCSQSDTYKH